MKVRSIAELLEGIQGLQAQHPDELFFFRGEAFSGWELRPSVMRQGFLAFESQMLIDLITRRPDEFSSRESAISQWVLAQHHGLKTRFLDITKNPLVALFYACESRSYQEGRLHIFAVHPDLIETFNSDRVGIVANFAKLSRHEQEVLLSETPNASDSDYLVALTHLYQLVRQEKPSFEQPLDARDLGRVFVIEPQQSTERIRLQSGAFLASAYHRRFERESILAINEHIPVYAHYTPTVSWNRKRHILTELALLNITRETLFPGLDESARAITQTYRQRLREAESTASGPE